MTFGMAKAKAEAILRGEDPDTVIDTVTLKAALQKAVDWELAPDSC